MADSSFSKVDEYGFERPDCFDYGVYEEFMSSYIKVLARRTKKWQKLLDDNKTLRRNLTLKRYVRKGIPWEYRGQVWLAISGADDLRKNMAPEFYQNLLNEDLNPTVVETIKLDLPRTFPDNIYFKTMEKHQLMLFNVLAAYAHHNPKVGYCQGLNYIAGLLILATKSEEASFWLLKVLVEQILEDYYSATMEGVIVDIEVFARLIRTKAPEVHQKMTEFGLPWAVISTKWFVCLFAEVLPVETVLRIWDCLFYEGSKIIFRVGLTLIKEHYDLLLSATDFNEMADAFKAILKHENVTHCHSFTQKQLLNSRDGKPSRRLTPHSIEVEFQPVKSLNVCLVVSSAYHILTPVYEMPSTNNIILGLQE